MNRKQRIKKYFDKSSQLTVRNKDYQTQLSELFAWLIKADNALDDSATKSLALKENMQATIVAKQDGIIAGLEEVEFIVKNYIPQISIASLTRDGERAQSSDAILNLYGPSNVLLSYERAILNIFGRMSGIATQTQSLAKKFGNIPKIAATRKTPWMWLDKKAVSVGGGLTHRLGLTDEIMIKDNHLATVQKEKDISSIEEAIKHTIQEIIKKKPEFFELEVATLSQAQIAVRAFSAIKPFDHLTMTLLLDNWKPSEVKSFVAQTKKTSAYDRVIFEASGDITEKNIADWAQTGVDIISLGSLTHSAKNFNLSMKVK